MHSSKTIDISKSSLISLRAELARKKDEVAQAKSQSQFITPPPRVKKETIFTRKNNGVGDREVKDHEEEKEEHDLLKKSREALESKTKLYDKLSQSRGDLDEEENLRYLVDFQQKDYSIDLPPAKTFTPIRIADLVVPVSGVEAHNNSDSDDNMDPDDDWVDYTDCLGRTRRCLRRDLAAMKKQDSDLSGTLGYEEMPTPKPYVPPLYEECREGDRELLSEDMRREIMREKWEEQEKGLQDRVDVHYQDVLFDEARSHGVGYYGFSGDEEQRRAQQEALAKLRGETQQEQETTRAVRERRQKQLDARLKAANLRKRIRMGLPPEEEVVPAEVAAPSDIGKAAEEEAPAEKLERPAKKSQRPTVRPWDIGKEGVKETVEMSQEEWVKKRRGERDTEFAPPEAYQEDRFMSRSSTKKSKTLHPKKPAHTFSTPIDDEIDFEPPPSSYRVDKEANSRRAGPEIAPPPTYEYYGPSSSAGGSGRSSAKAPTDIEDSIMAGLRFLREQADRKQNQKEKGLLDIL